MCLWMTDSACLSTVFPYILILYILTNIWKNINIYLAFKSYLVRQPTGRQGVVLTGLLEVLFLIFILNYYMHELATVSDTSVRRQLFQRQAFKQDLQNHFKLQLRSDSLNIFEIIRKFKICYRDLSLGCL